MFYYIKQPWNASVPIGFAKTAIIRSDETDLGR